jgi:hypothetical protein
MQNRTMSCLYAIAGAVALACTTYMVHSLGMFQGATADGQWTLGIASVVVHLGGVVVFGIGTGMAFKARQRARAWVGVLIVIGAGAFSLWNIAGYVIAHSQSVVEAQTKHDAAIAAQRKALLDAAAERQRTQAKLIEDELKWSRGTVREVDGRRERKDMAEARAKLITDLGKGEIATSPPIAPPAAVVRPDANAAMVERYTGIARESIMLAAALFMALLLVAIEAIAWMRAGYHWRGTDESVTTVAGSPEGSGGKVKSSEESTPATIADRGENVIDLPARVATPPQLQADTACNSPEQTTVVNAAALTQQEATTPAASAAQLSPSQQTTLPLTVSSGPPVESLAPTQRRWTEDDVDALLNRVANDPKRPSWRAMGLMTGWDYAQLHKRWQRSTTGVNSAAHRALGKQRRGQHRQQEYRGSYPN